MTDPVQAVREALEPIHPSEWSPEWLTGVNREIRKHAPALLALLAAKDAEIERLRQHSWDERDREIRATNETLRATVARLRGLLGEAETLVAQGVESDLPLRYGSAQAFLRKARSEAELREGGK